MLIFETLSYRNFLSTGDKPTVIQLNKNTATLVVGANGAGKSTMLDALSFGLFGKPHRAINKPQLVNSINNKHCEVEVTFSVGPNRYRVFRSVKPGKFMIYKNDELLNQESHSRDYQKVLESNILKLNHKSFHQVVVLGSSSFIPFMQLPASQRRGVIEDLLDIGVFTKMNALTKERYAKLKGEIQTANSSIGIIQEKIRLQRKHINELKQIDLNQSVKHEKKIQDLESEVELLVERNKELNVKFDTEWPNVSVSIKELTDLQRKRDSEHNAHTYEIRSLVKQSKFYEDNDQCPTCAQAIGQELKTVKRNEIQASAGTITSAIKNLKVELSEISDKLIKLNEENEALQKIRTNIRGNDQLMTNLNKQVKSLKVTTEVKSIDTTAAEEELKDSEGELVKLKKTIETHSHVQNYFEAIFELLKDTGIKTKIIRQYLPVMNKLINQYLQILDFFVSFNLDESFTETIKSRHRDDFSYSSFSEGEKARIDLALLFAWRSIAKMKNSANTNLLILDETFDSSLDIDGVDNLIKILQTLRDDTSVFIISHKKDMLEGKFPAKIEFKKQRNFSYATYS